MKRRSEVLEERKASVERQITEKQTSHSQPPIDKTIQSTPPTSATPTLSATTTRISSATKRKRLYEEAFSGEADSFISESSGNRPTVVGKSII